MKTTLKVSILVPVFNVQNYIIKCLDSVAHQTYNKSIECIIIDDCGSDDSISLAEKFIATYTGPIIFRIIHHEHNKGLAAARNTAVIAAMGDFVFHLDSDDWLEPTAIEMLVKMQNETNADIVSGDALQHTNNGNFLLEEPHYNSPIEMVHKCIELTLDHVIWRRLIRKSLYIDHNILAVEGVNIGEDHHTLPRLAYYAQKVEKVNHIVYHYNCLNPNSYMTSTSSVVNTKRIFNDISSIDILISFFSKRDSYCTKRLEDIRHSYLERMLYLCSTLSDKHSYKLITQKYGIKKSYAFARGKEICKKLHAYLFGRTTPMKAQI